MFSPNVFVTNAGSNITFMGVASNGSSVVANARQTAAATIGLGIYCYASITMINTESNIAFLGSASGASAMNVYAGSSVAAVIGAAMHSTREGSNRIVHTACNVTFLGSASNGSNIAAIAVGSAATVGMTFLSADATNTFENSGCNITFIGSATNDSVISATAIRSGSAAAVGIALRSTGPFSVDYTGSSVTFLGWASSGSTITAAATNDNAATTVGMALYSGGAASILNRESTITFLAFATGNSDIFANIGTFSAAAVGISLYCKGTASVQNSGSNITFIGLAKYSSIINSTTLHTSAATVGMALNSGDSVHQGTNSIVQNSACNVVFLGSATFDSRISVTAKFEVAAAVGIALRCPYGSCSMEYIRSSVTFLGWASNASTIGATTKYAAATIGVASFAPKTSSLKITESTTAFLGATAEGGTFEVSVTSVGAVLGLSSMTSTLHNVELSWCDDGSGRLKEVGSDVANVDAIPDAGSGVATRKESLLTDTRCIEAYQSVHSRLDSAQQWAEELLTFRWWHGGSGGGGSNGGKAATPSPTWSTSSTPTTAITRSTSQSARLTTTSRTIPALSTSRSATQPLSRTATDTLEIAAPPLPLPTPATPPAATNVTTTGSQRVKISVVLPGGGATVMTTAGASSAVVGALGGGGVGAIVAAGAAVKLLECGLTGDSPRPELFELMIQVPVGGGRFKWFTGAMLAHSVISAALMAVMFALHRWKKSSSSRVPVQIASMIWTGAHQYFGPNIFGAASTVLFHSEEVGEKVIACGCFLVAVSTEALATVCVYRALEKGVSASSENDSSLLGIRHEFRSNEGAIPDADDNNNSNDVFDFSVSGSTTLDLFRPRFDGCRDFDSTPHRCFFTFEFVFASAIAMVAGSRPEEHCTTASTMVAAIGSVGLALNCAWRPYRTRLDTFFSIITYMILATLGFCVSAAIATDAGEDDWRMGAINYCMTALSALFYVQLLVQFLWGWYVSSRRKKREAQQSDGALHATLLLPVANTTSGASRNRDSDTSSGGSNNNDSFSSDGDEVSENRPTSSVAVRDAARQKSQKLKGNNNPLNRENSSDDDQV